MLIKLINGLLAWLIIFLFAGTLFAQNKSPYTLAALNMNALSSPEAEPVRKKESRSACQGPYIDIRYPAVITSDGRKIIEIQSPMRLDIAFVKREAGDSVNMNSLEVTGKKGWFSKRYTDRIRPYVDGNMINVSGVSIPSGTFYLQVSIADVAGVRTTEEYILVVR
jgi:hypothetical protein